MNTITDLSDKYKLGKLCPKGHDYEQTGQSLRYAKKDGKCITCCQERSKAYRKNNPEKTLLLNKDYYARNRERLVEYRRDYIKNNPESVRQTCKRWREKNQVYLQRSKHDYYLKNKERILDKDRIYRLSNKDKIKLRSLKYYQNNPEKIRANRVRRDARLRQAYGLGCTAKELKDRLSVFDGCCSYCEAKKPMTVDHFLPISKGGTNALGNIVPACSSCNSSKNASDPFEWYSKQDFYSKKRWQKILKILGKTEGTYNQIPLL